MYTYFWDIETSKIKCDNGEEVQVTYLSNVLQMNTLNGKITDSKFFRTIAETISYFDTLEECIIWCHNLDYELTFLLRELGQVNGEYRYNKLGDTIQGMYKEIVQDVILRDKHAPLSIKLNVLPHITFRDSYALFNKSVEQLGNDLGARNKRKERYNKLEYNYKEVRLPTDKLTTLDYQYNKRDNEIVAFSIFNFMQDNNITFEKLPLTFTSFVKMKRKEFIVSNYGKKGLMKFFFDKNDFYDNFNFFENMLRVYQGGLTASNIEQTGKFIDNGVFSIDIKSSYPYQMCSRYFPFFGKENTVHYTNNMANNYFINCDYKGFFGVFKFKNIRVKNRNYLLPISSSQISKGRVSSDRVLFNGKLLSANELVIPCNNIDIDVIDLVYNYDEIVCLEIFATDKQRRLRQEEVSFLLNAFSKKETTPNHLRDGNIEYALAKVYINAMYGVKVTIPIKSSYTIEDGEILETDYFSYNVNDREEIYNSFLDSQITFGGSLDIFTDGCYITSYARLQLVEKMTQLVDMGCSVIYADTDSLKFYLENTTKEELFTLLEQTNSKIIFNNKKNIRFKNFKEQFEINDNDFEKIVKLGIWELENENENDEYKLFVTYGAKKYGYITKDNKVVTTIAGCNKKKPPQVIKNVSKKYNMSLEDSFKLILSLGTQFDTSASGRTTAKVEKRTREEMEQLTYKGVPVNQYGGIIIEDTTYTLNVTHVDGQLLGITSIEDVLLKVNLEGEISYE